MANKTYLIIEADVNDGDYISAKTIVTDKVIDTLKPIIKKIKACKDRSNWEDPSDYLSDEEIETISEYLPSMDNQDVHTIVSIDVLEVINEKSLL